MAPPSLFKEQHTAIIKDGFEDGKTDSQIATVIFNETGLIVTGMQVKNKRQKMAERQGMNLKHAQGGNLGHTMFTEVQDGLISLGFSMGLPDKENAKNVNAKTGSSYDHRQIAARRETKGLWWRTNTKLDSSQLLETGKLINAAKVDGTSIAKSHAIVSGTAAGLGSETSTFHYNTALKYTAMARRNGDAKPAAKEPSMTKQAIRNRENREKKKRGAEEAACEERAAENLAGLKSCGDEENDENDRGGFL